MPADAAQKTAITQNDERRIKYRARRPGRQVKIPAPPRILALLPIAIIVSGLALVRFYRAERAAFSNSQAEAAIHRLVARQWQNGTLDPTKHHSHTPDLGQLPSYIPYHVIYTHLPPALGITLLILWLLFLFSFLGIVASDFFCPNLSTLAARLGLPEDVAGATMVGWANGAPDLFSTFASLKAGSGSLAIGELLGAASFICCVVAGCMVLVKPFKVQRFNFFRDVGFFTVAVAFAMIILRDGQIHAWEAKCMCVLYLCYVVLVAVGSWWRRRRWRRKERERLAREAWNESSQPLENPYDDDVDARTRRNMAEGGLSRSSRSSLTPLVIPEVMITRSITEENPAVLSTDNQEEDYFNSSPIRMSQDENDENDDEARTPLTHTPMAGLPSPFVTTPAVGRRRSSTVAGAGANSSKLRAITPSGHARSRSGSAHPGLSHTRSVSQSHHILPPATRILHRSSILGAIEFRDVVNSLRAESSTTRQIEGIDTPITPSGRYAGTPRGMSDSSSHSGHTRLGSRARSISGALPARPTTKRLERVSSNGSAEYSPTPSRPPSFRSVERTASPEPIVSASTPELAARSRRKRDAQSIALPELNDPWKNAAVPLSRSSTPGISISEQQVHEQHAREFKAWGGSASGTGLCELDGEDGDAEDSPSDMAGESDVTARPGPSNDTFSSTTAMRKVPSKARRLLGLTPGSNSGPGTEAAVPPKAQRVLGLPGALDGPSASHRGRWRTPNWRYIFAAVRAMAYAVFPSLHNFRKKSILAMMTSLVAVPAVLLLNLTLPVVDESEAEDSFLEELEKERLELEGDEEGQIRLAEDDVEEDGGIIDLESGYNHSHSHHRTHIAGRRSPSGDDIEDELDRQEHDDYERNVRRTLAIAEELHSPVATHHHHHDEARAHAHSEPTPGANGLLAPPGRALSVPVESKHYIDSADIPISDSPARVQSPVLAAGSAAVPDLPSLDDLAGPKAPSYDIDDCDLNRYLTALQCFLAPMFCVVAIFGNALDVWYLPVAFVIGTSLATLVVLFFQDEKHATRVLSLCCIGFIVAIVWILTIVNEVVGVLQVSLRRILGIVSADFLLS